MDLLTIKEFFFYLWLVNLGIYLFTVIALLAFGDIALKLEKFFLKLDDHDLKVLNAKYLANFKLFNILFAFSPWLALVIIS